jgi:acyl-CoA synthetase (AMP-forming)/AMP-acid ligase II
MSVPHYSITHHSALITCQPIDRFPASSAPKAPPPVSVVEDSLMAWSGNVARRLTAMARRIPGNVAVAAPLARRRSARRQYQTVTFRQLDDDSDQLARALRHLGVENGTRIALLVRPGIDFIALVFALLKSGAVAILIDPGMGRKNLIGCLSDAMPEGMIGIPAAQAARIVYRRRFPKCAINVTVGRSWGWSGPTLSELRQTPASHIHLPRLGGEDDAAIIFTTGSTGPPKGVLYRHAVFDRQVTEIRDHYGIQPGEIDLPGFPLFGLFNCAMGVTTVVPDMDPTRPARVNPQRFIEAIHDWQVTQSFGSPAIWNRVGEYCQRERVELPTLRRVLSAGAPVPPRVLKMVRDCLPLDGEMHTPYGATEALPVASISAGEVLDETASLSAKGAGTCVGRRFPGITWKVIRVADGPLATLAEVEELPTGEIGELIVTGEVVTREYFTRREVNALAKIRDGERVWHRMGDVGYLDGADRFWFCGRAAHRVTATGGTLFTIPCEAIFNGHSDVFRSALVGVGAPGAQRPVLIVEPWPGKFPRDRAVRERFVSQLRELGAAHAHTRGIDDFLFHRSMPVDIRHNAKIFREKLAVWAAKQLTSRRPS